MSSAVQKLLSYPGVSKSDLPSKEADEAEDKRQLLREWKNREVQNLVKLTYAIGIGKIVLAYRNIDEHWFEGEYISARVPSEAQRALKPWKFSPRQLVKVNRTLRSGRDVILLDESCISFTETLTHEIGHYINDRLGGLSPFELCVYKDPALAAFSRVTPNMRRVARFHDEYFYQNRGEYYAELWSQFLCGNRNCALLRYLQRPLRNLRTKHPHKARLIERHRIKALREKRMEFASQRKDAA